MFIMQIFIVQCDTSRFISTFPLLNCSGELDSCRLLTTGHLCRFVKKNDGSSAVWCIDSTRFCQKGSISSRSVRMKKRRKSFYSYERVNEHNCLFEKTQTVESNVSLGSRDAIAPAANVNRPNYLFSQLVTCIMHLSRHLSVNACWACLSPYSWFGYLTTCSFLHMPSSLLFEQT